jgi:putative oxidoreductase
MRYYWPADTAGRFQLRIHMDAIHAGYIDWLYQRTYLAPFRKKKMTILNTLNNNTPAVQTTGRIMIAVLFLVSGMAKLLAPGPTLLFIAASGLPFAKLAFLIAVAVEIGGGLLLAFGIQTRAVALGLAMFSLVTGLAFHHAIGDQMQLTELLKNIAIAGGLLHIATIRASMPRMKKASHA